MADVNWTKYRCDLCLMIGLIAAAAVSALVGWLLMRAGVPMILSVLLFLVAWAALGLAVDGTCRKQAKAAAAADMASAAAAAEAGQTDEASAKLAAEAEAAAKAEAEQAAAAAAEEAAAKAAAEKAAADAAAKEAADKAAAEKAAADAAAKAAVEREADEKAAQEAAEKEAAEKAEKEAAARAAAEQAEKKAAEKAAAEKAEAGRAAAEEAAKAEAAKSGDVDRDGDGVIEGKDEGTRPEALTGPRGGEADDLKRIKGIGPKLEILCNELGFYHFDQIAGWTSDEVAWVDSNLEGFRGRVTRDEWVAQAKTLAQGEETEFSKRVDDGDVPSSQ